MYNVSIDRQPVRAKELDRLGEQLPFSVLSCIYITAILTMLR